MRLLFLHPVFPGQFHKVMEAAAALPGVEVLHASHQSALKSVPGIKKLVYRLPEREPSQSHPFLKRFEDAVIQGEVVQRVAQDLKRQGYVPDLIYAYGGWGPAHFMKDVFPDVPLVCYLEWYLNAFGSEYNFDPQYPLDYERQLLLRCSNAPHLVDLAACDYGITPTHWQRQQFPKAFRDKISVLHDGVDTDYYIPDPDTPLVLPDSNLDLTGITEIVTYAARGLEPFRGFPQFMQALAILQKRRPNCHAVIVGGDDIHYSRKLPNDQTYREKLLTETDLDLSRVHFTGWVSLNAHRRVLQASKAHVYLTYPYVLSWSLMDAMACGCLIVGSKTSPVEEVIRHGENGLLVDFFSPAALADALDEALGNPEVMAPLRENARQQALAEYSQTRLLPQHLALIEQWSGKSFNS